MPTDAELIARYVATQDQAAFGELVTRYLPLVLASARRRVNDPGLAEDVAQAVFIVLAKKAGTLKAHRPIGDWLLTVTKHTAANAIRQRQRRAKHEAAAGRSEGAMPPTNDTEDREAWTAQLDAALDRLSSADRQAILLRYYQAAEYDVVAAALGVSEPAARKRVTRAVERLRSLFARRGITVPAAALSAALPLVLTTSPSPALAISVLSSASAAAVSASAVALSKGALHAMFMTKLKLAAGAIAATALITSAGVGLRVALAADTKPVAATQPTGRPTKLLGEPKLAGWVHSEVFLPDGRLGMDGYYELSSGRMIMLRQTDPSARAPEPPAPPIFDDPVAGLSGRYFKEMGQYVVGPIDPGRFTVPHTEQELAGYFGDENGRVSAFERTGTPAEERVVDLVIDLTKLPADLVRRQPKTIEIHTDRATGLLRRVHLGLTESGDKAYDLLIVTPVDAPPIDLAQPQAFPLPPGTEFVDNRPTPQVQTVLKQLNDIVREGPGFNAGVLVTRSASPTDGEFSPDLDEVTICAGTPERFVIATWAIGKGASGAYPAEPQRATRPAGWPTPTFLQTLAAVGDTRPNLFFVNDGQNLDVSDSYANPFNTPPTPTGFVRRDPDASNVDPIWNRYSIAGQIWGTFLNNRPGVRTRFELANNPRGNGRVTLDAKTETMFSPPAAKPNDKPQLITISAQRLTYFPNLGPYPLRIESLNRSGQSPDERFNTSVVVDFSSSPAWMFREPLRVPDTWRTMVLNETDLSYTRYTRLIPAKDNADVPAEWYGDPAVSWPRGK